MKFFNVLSKILKFIENILVSFVAFILVIPLALMIFAIYIVCEISFGKDK